TTSEELEAFENRILGRKGEFTELAKGIATASLTEKPLLGQMINEVKRTLVTALDAKKASFMDTKHGASLDVTMPGSKQDVGHLHPITYAIEEIEEIFKRLGFVRVRYNEVEWDYYAFEALNMPSDHPARDEWETFFISEKPVGPQGRILLTPHTSSGQVREMKKYSKEGLPIRMLNIAKTYRRQIDISHLPMFHQFEGLVVDTHASMAELVGVLNFFVKEFFSPDRRIRLRPYHFRFTEPSFEVDISCALCAGGACAYCKDGWTELGGAGMVHPNVLTAGGYNPAHYTGFAFGFGVERTYLMKNNLNIGDLRLLYTNDIRFLEQF
ncbi:MAG: phenylalanine--tRNA ligase subunit alpha, partial [bacterium]|nr:phenylalanine--tRNA ligase subunit alpha [bacterium]